VRRERRSVVGVDLGGSNVRAGSVRGGRLEKLIAARLDAGADAETVLARVFSAIDPFFAGRARPAAVGAGVPSVIDPVRGIVYDVQNIPAWRKMPLKERLEARYGVPAYVNNDANCFASGEKRFGKARPFRHAVGLIVGTGLGAGIIIDGRLYAGPHCGAGEVGMVPYLDGTYEDYASGRFFAVRHGTTGEELARLARRGDPRARRVFAEFGGHLAEAIKTILYVFDPEIIVLGGSVSWSYRFFARALRARLRTFAYAPTLRDLRIAVSTTPHIAVLGAAALCLDALRDNP
jgi:glucokinase